jgi:hypothetical protein
MGIEPTYAAWKAAALPLNYTRNQCGGNHNGWGGVVNDGQGVGGVVEAHITF